MDEMELIDLVPIAVSVLALAISAFSLGWTVYRDVRKPRFRVSVSIKRIFQQDEEPSDPFITIEALNLGPQPNRVGLPWAEKSWWRRRILRDEWTQAMITPDYSHPATSPPHSREAQTEVGDAITYAFPYNSECFLGEEQFVRVGIVDGYGRAHYAPKSQLRDLQKRHQEEFS